MEHVPAIVEETTELPAVMEGMLMDSPKDVLDDASVAAKALIDMVKKTKQSIKIGGGEHLRYEAWMTVARFYGCVPKTGEAEPIEINNVFGFKARATVVNRDGQEISGAEAYCMADEPNWKNKPLFQLASMAQTRAGGKALRNVFAWVAVLAGYQATPAEEMSGMVQGRPANKKAVRVPKATKSANGNGVSKEDVLAVYRKGEPKGITDDGHKQFIKESFGIDSLSDLDPVQFAAWETWIDGHDDVQIEAVELPL